RLAERGLGDEVERALGQRVDRAGAVGGGEGGHHHDRQRFCLAFAQGLEHADAVHPGHGEIERHRVGTMRAACLQGLVAVGRGRDDVEALPTEGVGEDAAHEARVVGNDDGLLGRGGGCHGGGSYAAASWSALAPANRPSALRRITRRSPILAIAEIVSLSAVGTSSSWSLVTVRTSSTSPTTMPAWP